MNFLKKRFFVLIGILFWMSGPIIAQNSTTVDSLRLRIEQADNQENWYSATEDMYYHWLYNNYDSALVYARSYLHRTKTDKDPKRESIALNLVGFVYDYREQIDSATWYYKRSLKIRETLGDKKLIANNLSNLGVLNYHSGNYEEAIEYYFEAIRIREEISDSSGLSQSYNNLGILLRNQGEFKKALDYYQRSAELKEALGKEYSAMYTQLNIGSLYLYLEEYDSSLVYSWKALEIANKYEDRSSAASLKLNIGNALSNIGQWKEAEEELISGIDQLIQIGEYGTAMEGYGMLMQNYLSAEKKLQALQIFQEARVYEDSLKEPQLMLDYVSVVSAILRDNGQYAQALAYKDIEGALKDSLFREDSKKALLELETRYEVSKKEQELALLNTENQLRLAEVSRAKTTRNLSVFIALLLVALTGYVYRNNKVKEELNRELSLRVQEKELLMKEVHHRVKNNLQIVSSLLNIQSRESQDENAKGALRQSRNRVQSMALIHQNLYKKDTMTSVQSKDYLTQLLLTILRSYGVEDTIELRLDIDPIELDVDTTIPLGLIINELVTNTVKYAFEPGDEGKLSVSLKVAGSMLRLSVSDNGKGLEESFTDSNSFGMNMVRTLSEKLKADLRIEDDKGTSIYLDIHDYRLGS